MSEQVEAAAKVLYGRAGLPTAWALLGEGQATWRSLAAEALDAADAATVVTTLDEPHPCGHVAIERGCGGCDPGAIEYVIDNGLRRAFDPARDMAAPTTEEAGA